MTCILLLLMLWMVCGFPCMEKFNVYSTTHFSNCALHGTM